MVTDADEACTVEGCDRPGGRRGLCDGHYGRLSHYGDVQADVPLKPYRDRQPCKVDGCDRPAATRGLCDGHYGRLMAFGDVRADEPLRPYRSKRSCKVAGCDRRAEVRGLCAGHYSRLMHHDDVRVEMPLLAPVTQRVRAGLGEPGPVERGGSVDGDTAVHPTFGEGVAVKPTK